MRTFSSALHRAVRFDRSNVEDWIVWGLRAFLLVSVAWAFAGGVPSGQTSPVMVVVAAATGIGVSLVLSAFPAADLRALRVVDACLLVAFTLHAIGHLGGLYDSVLVYDDLVHASGGFLAAIAGFALVRGTTLFLPKGEATPFRMAFIALAFVNIFAVGVEVFEFANDQLLGTKEQTDPDQPPLVDTMWDLIVAQAGGAIAVALGLAAVRDGHVVSPRRALRRLRGSMRH